MSDDKEITGRVASVITPKRCAYQRMDNVHHDNLILNTRHEA